MALAISHQFQPTPTSCGQTCIAMLLGIPARQVIRDMDDGPTVPRELAEYLRPHGFNVPDRLVRMSSATRLPAFAIVRVLWAPRTRHGHWVLWSSGDVFDPLGLIRVLWSALQPSGSRATSFLPIAPRKRRRTRPLP